MRNDVPKNCGNISAMQLQIQNAYVKFCDFAFSWRKLLFYEKKIGSRFLSDNTQNYVKLPKKWVEKMSGGGVVCVYVKKFELLYPRNYAADPADIWCASKPEATLSVI